MKKLFGGTFEPYQIKNRIIEIYPNDTYYTNVLTEKEVYKQLEPSSNHLILNGGVGSGKTTLAKQLARYFYLKGYTIIYLGNRRKLITQTDLNEEETMKDIWETETNIFSNIVFNKWTYQSFTSDWFDWEYDSTKKYFFIMDEIHYCYADAGFNFDTVKMLEFIQEYQNKITFCLISASAEQFFDELTNNYCQESMFYQHYIPDNFEHVKNWCYFYKKEQIKTVINHCIKNNEKMIYFTNDMDTWQWFYDDYKEYCCFVQTQYEPTEDDDEAHWKRWNKRQNMIEETNSKESYHSSHEKDWFDKPILITTSTLDNGVSIIDNDIKYVVIDFKLNATSIYQAIGRVRANENTSIDVFFKIMSSSQYDKHCQDHVDNVDLEQAKSNECYRKNWRIQFELDLQIKRKYQETQNFHEALMNELFHKTIFRKQKQIIIDIKQYFKQLKIDDKVNETESIINAYLNKDLKSKDIKSIATECKWYDEQRHILSVDKTIDKLQSLGYEVETKIIRKVKQFKITK